MNGDPRIRLSSLLPAALSLIFLFVSPGWTQSRAVVTIDRDLRVFTMMSALNAAGFDVEWGARSEFHPVRAEVRATIRGVKPELIARMKQFYESHKDGKPDEAQLSKYLALALILNGPPDFSPVVPEDKMPPEARSVLAFASMLREFFVLARISEHWELSRPFFEREVDAIGAPVRDTIRRTDAYLRTTVGAGHLRTMSIYLELTAPKNSVNLQSTQDDYSVVIGSSATPRVSEIRHAYLHLSLDADLFRLMPAIERARPLVSLIAREPDVSSEYTSEPYSLVTESLIRAIELRMDRLPTDAARTAIDGYYRSGLLLVPFFVAALPAYEQEEKNLTIYLPAMLAGLSVKDEEKRFRETFHTIPLPERRPRASEPIVVEVIQHKVDPLRDLLVDASRDLTAGNIDKAKEEFDRVLSTFDRENGAALYGLALIAGKADDDKAARRYFERVVKSLSSELSVKVWSYIYLGRLDDLECERAHAIENYREAVKVGDDARNAQSAANEGLIKAYGDGCRQ